MQRPRTRLALAGAAALAALVTCAAGAQAKWSTISDEIYQGGLICRDGMTFEWGSFTATTDHVPPPVGPLFTRLAVTWAAAGVPDGQPTTTNAPDPLPPATYPQVAYDEHLHADYDPQLVSYFGTPLYLIDHGRYQINWRQPRDPGDHVRLIFNYPDALDHTVDIGGDVSRLVSVRDCLLPRLQVAGGGTPTIDPGSNAQIVLTILSNPRFDATTIKRGSVRAGNGLDLVPALSQPTYQDVNGDGRRDVRGVWKISSLQLPCHTVRVYATGKDGSGRLVVTRAAIQTTGC